MSSVDKPNKEYNEMIALWQRCCDVSDGEDQVKSKKELYLLKLSGQSDEDYKAYLKRPNFFNATYRTIAGLVGLAFRKDPTIKAQDSILELLKDITLSGVPINDFAKDILEEYIETGKVAVLVDYPQKSTDGMTAIQAYALNLRPTMQKYEADSIINWRYELVNNKYMLTLVVLAEEMEIRVNEFEYKCETVYRVLDLFNGEYRQRLFRIDDKKNDQLIAEFLPIMNGSTLDYVPFFILDFDLPPLIDLVNVNLAHFRISADYEHACHFTGLPTPIVSGYIHEEGANPLYIGSSSAWVFPSPDAKAFYLEFTGQGISALVENLDRKEQHMAILGARMLSADKKQAETAEAAQIHRAGEQSILASLVQDVSKVMTNALKTFSAWAGVVDDNISIEINQDFVAQSMTAQELTALVSAWQLGAMSQQALFDNMKRGGLYPEVETFEDEQSKIADTSPAAPLLSVSQNG
jgi:hypothetical protein